jgi:hypothetical protein
MAEPVQNVLVDVSATRAMLEDHLEAFVAPSLRNESMTSFKKLHVDASIESTFSGILKDFLHQ